MPEDCMNIEDLTKLRLPTNSRNPGKNPSKYASQLDKNLKSLSLVLVAWQPSSGSTEPQETNVQRLSMSSALNFHACGSDLVLLWLWRRSAVAAGQQTHEKMLNIPDY